MIHPIPPGTRDVLPDEMRELRRLNRRLIEVFEDSGYGEVATPAIEYDEVLARGDRASSASPYRFFDENGDLLALRADMTVPIARLVASRFADAPPPLRLCYLASAYRAVLPQRGEMREFVQAGIELIGVPGAAGTAEVVGVLEAALDAAGLDRAVIGLGDADLYRSLLAEFGVEGEARDAVLDRLATHDLVGLEAALAEAGIGAAAIETCVALSQLRGGREVLDRARELGGPPLERTIARLQESYDLLAERGAADRVQIDLGLLRDLGYYDGAIFEVYDPALGHVLGGGGRYDGFLANFGVDLPAAGFSLYLERVHVAQMEEESRRRERAGAG
ncbi:MAG TPA: ATP phosphoribosyltransferase regulatory subunit [Solirubrobacterales bacterium]|jgi:ATP phosphoribosyltransferase regulatory subunit|nr:ATP phosphoribosyltransferase regulatory subunit [Solirubrobacterales bacterium]